MKSLTSWLLIFFLVMFWIFRVIVTVACQYSATEDFAGLIVFDKTWEITLLFVSLLCFILIARRMIFGAIIYIARIWFLFWKIHISKCNSNAYFWRRN